MSEVQLIKRDAKESNQLCVNMYIAYFRARSNIVQSTANI